MSPELKRPALTDFYVSLAIQEPLLDVIDQAREDGKVVLMDRGPLSLAAYQIYGAGVDAGLGWKHVGDGLRRIRPDLTLLYDMDPEPALERNRRHPEKSSYFERKPSEYFEKVAAGFREAAKRYDAVSIDASGPVGQVHERTMSVIHHLFA
jgi:thymidylate kinase